MGTESETTPPTAGTPAPAASKPGIRTTEFWLTTFAAVVGALLSSGLIPDSSPLMKGLGVAAMVLSILGYTVQRSGVKKILVFLVAAGLAFGATGCSRGTIKADAIAPLMGDVLDRHDRLVKSAKDVNGDGAVDAKDDADRATFLRSAELLRRTVQEARSP